MDPKLEKYRDSFIKEMNGRLDVLKEFVPGLKGRPEGIKPAIEEIYRACHSIKGTAAFMGCADIAERARPLEKYLDQIRAAVMGGKDIREAVAGVEYFPEPDGRGRIAGSLRELEELLTQSVDDLEKQIDKI